MLCTLIKILILCFGIFSKSAYAALPELDYSKESNELLNIANELSKRYLAEATDFTRTKDEAVKPEPSIENGKIGTNGNKLEKYVFISLSIPEGALMDIIHDAKTHGFKPILRGFKENSYKKTVDALANIVKQTGYGVIIDPELFKTYEINT